MTSIRPSGLYAVVDGEQVKVSSHGTDYALLPAPGGRIGTVRAEIADLEDFVSVKTFAVWRGGTISVSAVSGDECGFDVEERVTSIHPRSREA